MLESLTGRRHTLIWVDPRAWREQCLRHPGIYPEKWASQWRPFVVRRSLPQDPTGTVPAGLPLPPNEGKKRLNANFSVQDIVAVSLMPELARARIVAPPQWQPVIVALLELQSNMRVYGSLAWQFLTGLPYLSDTSDLDLLIDLPTSAVNLKVQAARLREIGRNAGGVRLDGEYVRADGLAVKWRELARPNGEVLIKGLGGVEIMPRETFLAEIPVKADPAAHIL